MSTAKKTEGLQEKPEKKAAARTADKGTKVYIGPTIPGIVIAGTVFNNGFPKKLKEAMEAKKALTMLMVPVLELPKARLELKKPGSVLGVCYEKMKEER